MAMEKNARASLQGSKGKNADPKTKISPVGGRVTAPQETIPLAHLAASIVVGILIGVMIGVLGLRGLTIFNEEAGSGAQMEKADVKLARHPQSSLAGKGHNVQNAPSGSPANIEWIRHHDLAWARHHGDISRPQFVSDCDFQTRTFNELKMHTFVEPIVIRGVLPKREIASTIEYLAKHDPVLQTGNVRDFATVGPDSGSGQAHWSKFEKSTNSTLFETVVKFEEGRKMLDLFKVPGAVPPSYVHMMQDYFHGSYFVNVLGSTMKQGFTPHVHGEAMFVHVRGSKKWKVNKDKTWPLFVNERTGKLNTKNVSVDAFVRRPGTTECLLREGDMLYIPHYYAHTVENLDDVTLGLQTMGSSPYLDSKLISYPGYFLHK